MIGPATFAIQYLALQHKCSQAAEEKAALPKQGHKLRESWPAVNPGEAGRRSCAYTLYLAKGVPTPESRCSRVFCRFFPSALAPPRTTSPKPGNVSAPVRGAYIDMPRWQNPSTKT